MELYKLQQKHVWFATLFYNALHVKSNRIFYLSNGVMRRKTI